ncbi:MAG TPA: transcription elongation factor GreA, partial [Spirochaetia bacterium]|nr:transcription elongation factor GreA [Spirochaetia bacterium]
MATELLKTITDLLNEEKWTRATLNSYSITNFKDLDLLIDQARSEGLVEEVRELTGEHLKHTSNSIIALYVSGVMALSRELVDDTNLIMLISIFMDNHKWNIVEFLAERILAYGENKYALRTLGECYENKDDEPRKLEIWDRLIRVDYEEAEIVKTLGEKREQAGDAAAAVDYYKKAIHRFINKKQFASVKELWDKLIKLSPDDIDFFFHIEGRIARALNGERAASLLVTLIPPYKEKEDWNTCIEILKKVLAYDSKNNAARKEIIESYRRKYAAHSQLEEYIKISNLTQNWRSVHEAIADFEKHIGFDTGNYVFHRSWGIGRISASKDDTFTIDFANKTQHKMSLKMAVSALEVLSSEHIWVLKKTLPKEELAKKVKEDPAWALKVIIRSFGNVADMKRIKAELVPEVLSAGEWSRWNTEARSVLKKDSAFGNLPDKVDQFVVRDKPISFEEKTYNKFKAEKGFFDRVKTLEDYMQAGHAEPDSDWFTEMFSYFAGFLKGYTAVSETVISSWLLLQKVIARYPFLSAGTQASFEELFGRIDKLEETFGRIEDPDLRKDLLVAVKKNIADWPAIFTRLFPLFPTRFIVDELVAASHWEPLTAMITGVVSRYRELRDAFVWVAKNLLGEHWLERMNLSREKIYIGLIHLLDITYRDIANKSNASVNRKTNRQIHEFLF